MKLSEGYLEDLRNHFDDGYALGRDFERFRIETIIKLDLLVSDDVKQRLFDLINGGKKYDGD